MPDVDFQETISTRLAVIRMITGSFLMSLVVLGVVPFVVPTEPTLDELLALLLPALAVAEVVMLFVVRRITMGTLALAAPDDLRVQQVVQDPAVLSQALSQALAKYYTGTIVGLAIAESVAVLGFVHAFLAGSPPTYLPYGGVAALLVLVQFPTTSGALSLLDGPERKGIRRLLEG